MNILAKTAFSVSRTRIPTGIANPRPCTKVDSGLVLAGVIEDK